MYDFKKDLKIVEVIQKKLDELRNRIVRAGNLNFRKGERVLITLEGSSVKGKYGIVHSVSDNYVYVTPVGEKSYYTYDCNCLRKVKQK